MIELKIIGRIGGDAIVKEIHGQKVINFSVAHSHRYTNQQNQKVESTTWVRCDMWVKKDGLSQYLKKGTLVYCSGEPKTYAYKMQDGTLTSSLQMRVNDVQLLSSSNKDGATTSNSNVSNDEAAHLDNAAGGNAASFEPVAADDLPF